MNLAELLECPTLSYLQLLNENANLETEVKIVESTETPDAHLYIAPNALVITTAMLYADDQKPLLKFIDNLRKVSAVGLAIKVSRFLNEIDIAVVDKCKQLRFPLIVIPDNKTLGDVYTDCMSQIWQTNRDSYDFVLNCQKVFSNLLLKKPNTRSILAALHNMLDLDIALLDPFGNPISMTPSFKLHYNKSAIRKLARTVNQSNSQELNYEIVNKDDVSHRANIYKIDVSTCFPFLLLVMDPENNVYTHSSLIIEQAIFSIAFTLSRLLTDTFFELQRSEMQYFNILKTSENNNEKHFYEILQKSQLHIAPSGRCVLLYIEDFLTSLPNHLRNEGYALIFNWLKAKFDKHTAFELMPLTEEKAYMLFADVNNIAELITSITNITDILPLTIGLKVKISIGSIYNRFDSLHQSYHDALRARQNGFLYDNKSHVLISRDQDYHTVFSHIPEQEKAFFCKAILRDLYTNSDEDDLRCTLKTWLLNQGNTAQTAADLYLHRNTVYNKIDKCKKLLANNLTDPIDIFNIQIALALLDD